MSINTVLLVLTGVSIVSLGTGLSLLALRGMNIFKRAFGSAAEITGTFSRRQKESFERQSRYIYRKNRGLLYSINLKIAQAGIIGWLNAQTLIIISVLLFVAGFLVLDKLIGNIILAFYIGLLFLVLPWIAVSTVNQINTVRIEKYMLYNMETLLNFVTLDKANIIGAFNEAKKYFKPRLFKRHTDMFMFEVHTLHREFKDSAEAYKNVVNIKTYGDLLDSISNCYKIGGDFELLLGHYIERLSNLQKAKIRRIINSTGTRIAIYFLVAANIGFFFILSKISPEGYILVTHSPFIMSFVFIGMFIVMYFGYKAGKLQL